MERIIEERDLSDGELESVAAGKSVATAAKVVGATASGLAVFGSARRAVSSGSAATSSCGPDGCRTR